MLLLFDPDPAPGPLELYVRANDAARRRVDAERGLLEDPPGHSPFARAGMEARARVAGWAYDAARAALRGADPALAAELHEATEARLAEVRGLRTFGADQAPGWAFGPGGRPA